MMSRTQSYWSRVRPALNKFLSGKLFFGLIVFYFVLQSSWIALVGLYPMSFDEDMHLSIIRFYAHYPNPFFSSQPPDLNQYGAVVHDPSYLYHYIMSFPWRVITHLSSSFTTQIIMLRFVNIALFVAALILFRQLLLKAKASPKMVNLIMLLFMFTPITSQLASQINYDNLLIPLMIICALATVKAVDDLKDHKINLWLIGWLVALLLLTSLVKYTFLTIFLGIGLFLLWQLIKLYRKNKPTFWSSLKASFISLSRLRLIILIAVVVLSFGLFFERYGMDVIRYHTPTPKCVQVIGVPACQSNGIYQRTILYEQSKPNAFSKNPFLFTYRWYKHMLFNTMMSLSGPINGYIVGKPLPLPYLASIVLTAGGFIFAAVFYRRIFNNTMFRLLLLSIVIYGLALWVTNYVEYLHTGRRVAVQGRYLIPFLPFLYLVFLQGYRQLLDKWPKLQVGLATVLVFAFMAGGGAATYILHSDAGWYWPYTSAIHANKKARNIIQHTIPGWGVNYQPYSQSSFDF